MTACSCGECLCDEYTESLQDGFWNFVSASKTLPLDGKARLSQRVAQMFRADMRQDVIQRAVALKDRQSLPFRNERAPDCLSQQVTGQLHQACERIVGMQGGITGEHRPLRKSSDDRLLVVDLELLG